VSGPAVWHPASEPPIGQAGKYSRQVVVMSKQWNLYRLAYYNPSLYESQQCGTTGGWQMPRDMMLDKDEPAFWCEEPKT
jgi:hypothetical protein